MTHDEMVAFGERVAAGIIEAHPGATDAELARLALLLGVQLILMGQLFAEDADLDVAAVSWEEFERASRWHEGVLAAADARGAAS